MTSEKDLNEKLLLDVDDMQVLTGMGRTKIRALLREQAIPNFRIGKCIRVSRVVFERWLEEQHRIAKDDADRLAAAKRHLNGRADRLAGTSK